MNARSDGSPPAESPGPQVGAFPEASRDAVVLGTAETSAGERSTALPGGGAR